MAPGLLSWRLELAPSVVVAVVCASVRSGRALICVLRSGVVSCRVQRSLLILEDPIRDGVKDVILDLRCLGLRAVMLTGDNASTARTVAEELSLDDSLADLKPADKVEAVKKLERHHGPVLMVGDGINDAPALAAATCGVAMGAVGSDAAIEAADVALMADDLAKVPEVLRLALRPKSISMQNIVFSLLLLAILIPLAVGGVLSVALAVLVHEISELIAVANGLRVATT